MRTAPDYPELSAGKETRDHFVSLTGGPRTFQNGAGRFGVILVSLGYILTESKFPTVFWRTVAGQGEVDTSSLGRDR